MKAQDHVLAGGVLLAFVADPTRAAHSTCHQGKMPVTDGKADSCAAPSPDVANVTCHGAQKGDQGRCQIDGHEISHMFQGNIDGADN